MSQQPVPAAPDASTLLVDVPIRFFTAIRTHRFYPAAAPQVQLSRNILLSSLAEVRRSVGGADVTVAVTENSILVCGVPLDKKDLSRQQIRGLRHFFNQFAIHSLVFHSSFDDLDCALFLHQLVDLMEKREEDTSASTVLAQNALNSVSVVGQSQVRDSAIHELEQDMPVFDKNGGHEMATNGNVNGKDSAGSQHVLSRDTVEEYTGFPLGGEFGSGGNEELLNMVLDVLFNLDLESDPIKRNRHIEESARTLAQIAPGLLAHLLAQLPVTPVGDACFFSVLQELTPARLEQVIVQLEIMALKKRGEGGQEAKTTLNRLAGMDESTRTDLRETLALHSDARELLAAMLADEAPPLALQQRLRHPKWSAAVLAAAAQQQATAADQKIFSAFNQALHHVDRETEAGEQGLVIRLAAARIAQLGTTELGGLVLRRFKGLFGERLYEAVLNQVSDPLLDQTIEHLSPRQLHRIVAELLKDRAPLTDTLQPADFIPSGSALFKKLARTRQAPRVQEEIAGQLDTHVLQSSVQPEGNLPAALHARLQEPKWAAKLLAISVIQAADPQNFQHGQADFSSYERMLRRYALLFDKNMLSEIAADAGSRLAAFSEEELVPLLMHPESTPFGEEIKEVCFRRLSGAKAGRLAALLRKKRDNLASFAPDSKELHAACKKILRRLRGTKAASDGSSEDGRGSDGRETGQEAAGAPLPETRLLEELALTGPETLRTHLRRGKADQAHILLAQLAAGLRHNNPDIRTSTASTLAVCAGILAQEGQWQCLDPLLPALGQVLRTPGLAHGDAALLISVLSRLCTQRLEEQRPMQAAAALRILQNFSETQLDEENLQRLNVAKLAREALQQCALPETLEALFDQYLHADTMRDAAAQALAAMGIESARYQIRQLLLSENSVERARILQLLSQGGRTSVIALLEQLSMEAPWFVSRSIIRLIGELGTSLLFTALQPFLAHEDIRVQHETLGAGTRIGGEHAKEFLIRALQQVDDTLKREVIAQILQNRDDCFVRPLCQLAQESDILSSKKGEELRLGIIQALESIGSKRALNALAEIGAQPQETGTKEEAAQATGAGHEPLTPQDPQPSRPAGQGRRRDTMPVARTPEEEQFFRLIEQGDTEKAKGFLLGLVSSAARQGDFARAEDLQHHLYSIEGLALREIIQAEELIERAKQELIPQEDLHIWEALNNRLTTEEFQAVYHSFEHRLYAAEEPLVRQGERNDSLFFINQGSVKVSYSDGKKDIFVTTLNRGHVAGESFFTPSIWTLTLSALIRVQAYLLPRSATISWEERFPGLRNKLWQFYDTFDHTWSVLERKRLERRRHERIGLNRKILVQPLNQHDYPMGRGFRAETLDIALGGLAFLVRIGRQENARVLLGRKMQVVFPVNGEAPYQYLPGVIIGVQPYQPLESDYSVHFRFDRLMQEEQLRTILK